jgi:hypothetical protein
MKCGPVEGRESELNEVRVLGSAGPELPQMADNVTQQ